MGARVGFMNMLACVKTVRSVFYQCAALIIFSMIIAVLANAVHPGGLSWVYVWTASDAAGLQNEGLERISTEDAWPLYAGGKALFVDAREPLAFVQGHLPGAVNVPVSETNKFLEQLGTFSQAGIELITYCDSLDCPLSFELAKILLANDIRPVRVLSQGIVGWYESGFPVEEGIVE
jgi:rhodanese-related sulfurtransferase